MFAAAGSRGRRAPAESLPERRCQSEFSAHPASPESADNLFALYFREGISASAGLDSALTLSDERCDDMDSRFVGVTVMLLLPVPDVVDVRVLLLLPLVRGLRSGRLPLEFGLCCWRLNNTSALRRVAWRSNTDGR